MNFLKRKVSVKSLGREEKTEIMLSTAQEEAKKARKIAEEKIDNIYAQLNGCGDRWFLMPKKTIDSCKEEENN